MHRSFAALSRRFRSFSSDEHKFRLVQQKFGRRVSPQQRSTMLLVGSLIGANVGVYLAMNSSPRAMAWVTQHAVCTPRAFAEGRSETLLFSSFVHGSLSHLAVNMIAVAAFAPPLVSLMGSGHFAVLYCASAVLAASAHIAQQSLAMRRTSNPVERQLARNYGVIGASGAVMGLAGMFCMQFPKARMYLLFVLPVPTWLIVPGLICFDLFMLGRNPDDSVSRVSHLAGATVGVLAFFVERRFRPHLFRRPFFRLFK
jgi:membrane associated rhomboid family serine protease